MQGSYGSSGGLRQVTSIAKGKKSKKKSKKKGPAMHTINSGLKVRY